MRFGPLGAAVGLAIAAYAVPDATQRAVLGTVVDAVDTFWGYGRFVYGKAAEALNNGEVVVHQTTLYSFAKVPNTANLGQPVYVAIHKMAANDFGWFQFEGLAVYKTNATVAANAAVGIGAAAGIVGTNTAGKQLLGVHNLKAATATEAKTNVQTKNGSHVLICPNGYDGWFLGIALSGTGIPASTVAAAFDPDGKTVYMGSAVGTAGDKLATATGSVTVTGTYTGYGAGALQGAHAQGAIT